MALCGQLLSFQTIHNRIFQTKYHQKKNYWEHEEYQSEFVNVGGLRPQNQLVPESSPFYFEEDKLYEKNHKDPLFT